MERTNYEASHAVIFSTVLLVLPYYVQIFFSALFNPSEP